LSRNLLAQYRTRRQQSEVEKLLWEHWAESPDLRDQLFELLSSSGRLDAQLDALKQQSPEIDKADWTALAQSNPAAERFWMESCLWQSRFEQATGAADALAAEYPADAAWGKQRPRSIARSPTSIWKIPTRRSQSRNACLTPSQTTWKPWRASGTSTRTGGEWLRLRLTGYAWRRCARATPMAICSPQRCSGIISTFQPPSRNCKRAGKRLADPAAFGYQAGAIEESQGNAGAAIEEYVASALADKPSEESRDRLLSLARRSATRAAVDAETAQDC
jgi:hypothetical protein